MLMANLNAVLQRPKIAENYARNAFDRSQVANLHYNLGALTPFFAEQFIAGSHVKLNRRIFQRTAAVNTAAFPTIDTHCEFFYVPLKLLMTQWYNWKLNIQDFDSSMFSQTSGYYPATIGCPNFNLSVVQNNILDRLVNGDDATESMFNYGHIAMNARKLLDNLGYGFVGDNSLLVSSGGSINPFLVNAFKLAAYQKVYYDHFRNTAYETNDPTAYNLDLWSVASTSNYNIPDIITQKLLTLRYVNYRKDYFQSLYPALNYVSSDPSGAFWAIPDNIGGVTPSANSNLWFTANSPNASQKVPALVQYAENLVNTQAISVNSIRSLFALDKLMRASAYAPKHVKDQMEARYGVKGVESGKESVRIGAMMSNIVIGEVTSTSDLAVNSQGTTIGGALGAIGGKGIGSDNFGNDIEFTCKDDCIILGVMYSMPRTVYDSTLVRNWNAKLDREDFFIPEYMNLGMQPIEHWQQKAMYKDSHGNRYRYVNTILGYQPRYMEYKEGIDLNHGQFNSNLALSDFVPHSNQNVLYGLPASGVNANYFKVKAQDLDAVFAQATDTSDDTTDKFITHIEVKCICNQNMSVHGQPSAGGLS